MVSAGRRLTPFQLGLARKWGRGVFVEFLGTLDCVSLLWELSLGLNMLFVGRFFLFVLILSFGELYLLIRVAQHFSLLLTLALCVLTGVLGGVLVRAQGLRTIRAIQADFGRGRLPTTQLASGLILIVIGAFLLTPGFITDTVAFLLLIPPIRVRVAHRAVVWLKDHAQFRRSNFQKGSQGAKMSGFEEASRSDRVEIEVDGEEVVPKKED